jgi:hypothetical protein
LCNYQRSIALASPQRSTINEEDLRMRSTPPRAHVVSLSVPSSLDFRDDQRTDVVGRERDSDLMKTG